LGLGDLTLLLVGHDSLAQQLHVHLEHRGADIERTEASEALDTIRVAVPDLIVLAPDAAASDGERIRDALMAAGKPPRVLALCDKKLGAKIATFKHDFVAALEHDIGAELIASCIESLCTLMGKPSSASRPLRSLVADVRRSHIPSKPSASKQTLTGIAPLAAPKPAAAVVAVAASEDRPTPVVPAPKPEITAAKPVAIDAAKPAEIAAPKPAAVVSAPPGKPVATKKTITSLAPERASQPTPLAAFLNAPPAAVAKIVISLPAPAAAAAKPLAAPAPAAKPAAPEPAPSVVAPPAPAPERAEEELDISVDSLPPPALPVSVPPSLPIAASPSLPMASSPTPTPLFIETQTATPAPDAPSLQPSSLEKARALALRLPRNQRYAVAAAALLCFTLAAAASVSSDTDDPIAAHAAASLNQAATKARPASAPAPVPAPAAEPAPAPILAAAPPAPSPAAATVSDGEDPEDSMVDGELFNPHDDPARAKANYLVNMGHRLRKQGRLGMAEASYLKALNVMPNYARAVSGLVAVHLSRRDGVEALRWAKKLVDLQPKRGAHQRLLGDAYALTGNKSAARGAWQLGSRLGDRTSRSRL
jgi:hypothetical protein